MAATTTTTTTRRGGGFPADAGRHRRAPLTALAKLVLLVLLVLLAPAAGDAVRVPGKNSGKPPTGPPVSASAGRYAYYCLAANMNLCLGVSPGTSQPAKGMAVQLKSISENLLKGLDAIKMRWNLDPFGNLELMNVTALCALQLRKMSHAVGLLPCQPYVTAGPWVYDYVKQVFRWSPSSGVMCATVSQCQMHRDPAQSCNPSVTAPETVVSEIVDGAVLHLNECFDQGSNAFVDAQKFVPVWDCAPGCTQELLDNNTSCDQACDNAECAFDKGLCTRSPTTAGEYEGGAGPGPIATAVPTLASKRPTPAPVPTGAPTPSPVSGGVDENQLDGIPEDGEGVGSPVAVYVVLFLIMLVACSVYALAQRRRAQQRRRKVQAEGELMGMDGALDAHEAGLGGGRARGAPFGASPHANGRMAAATGAGGASASEGDGAFSVDPPYDPFRGDPRFVSGSAVAMNQLKYHSRAAGHASAAVVSDNASQVSAASGPSPGDAARGPAGEKRFTEVRMV